MGSLKKYNLIFFDTFADAKAAKDHIVELSSECEQVNVVIREEGNMDDPDLIGLSRKIKVFAGKAWTTVHERRLSEGWYGSSYSRTSSPMTERSISMDLR